MEPEPSEVQLFQNLYTGETSLHFIIVLYIRLYPLICIPSKLESYIIHKRKVLSYTMSCSIEKGRSAHVPLKLSRRFCFAHYCTLGARLRVT